MGETSGFLGIEAGLVEKQGTDVHCKDLKSLQLPCLKRIYGISSTHLTFLIHNSREYLLDDVC